MPSRISKQHSHKDNEQTSNSDVKLSDSNNQLIVIPSYEDDLENLVSSSDSHIVQKHATPLKPGSKNFHELSSVKSTDTSPSLIGKKGKANWGLDINLLKNKFGFSWKKMGRNAGLFLIIILVFGVIISSAVAAWAIDIYNNSKPLNTQQLESSIVYAKDGKTELFKFFDQGKREVVSLCPIKDGVEDISQSCIPKVMQLAIIALEDAQIAYEKAIQAAKSAIDDLKAQLAAPSLDKKIIEAQQDNLEDLADNIDDLGEKVSKLTKKLTKSGAKLSETLQNNLITLENSLVNTSETIDILADDTERLKDNASPFLKTRVEKTIDAVKQTLQESDRAWQELISSATTELEKTSTPK